MRSNIDTKTQQQARARTHTHTPHTHTHTPRSRPLAPPDAAAHSFASTAQEKTYVCHVHNRQDKIAGLVVTDEEYPSRVAFTLISKVVDDFKQAHPISAWTADAR